jgi:AcrR family transcriptional regulator
MSIDAPKRRLSASARRALIVDAALEEFAAHGYEGASMGRIGGRAGISRTVLYDHFPSKRALFVALLEAEHADLLTHLRDAIVGDAPTQERVRAAIEAFFAFAEREPLAWRLLFPDHPPVDPDAAADHRRLRSEANRLLAAMLGPDARRAGLDPASPVGQAFFALQQAALRGAVRWWHAHPDVTRQELVEAAMALMWTGIGGLERAGEAKPQTAARVRRRRVTATD